MATFEIVGVAVFLTVFLGILANFVISLVFVVLDNEEAVMRFRTLWTFIPGINIIYFMLNLYILIRCLAIHRKKIYEKEPLFDKGLYK